MTTKVTLTVTDEQAKMILAAVRVCTRSGGGSLLNNLGMDLSAQMREQGIDAGDDYERLQRYSDNVISEAREAGVI